MPLEPRDVVVLSFWDPWESSHGGTMRTRAFCEAFAHLGASVACIHPASPTSIPGVVDGVERIPVEGQTVGHQRWPSALQRLKRWLLPMPTVTGARSPALEAALRARESVDLLVVSHLTAVQYAEIAPDAALWLDQSDLWSEFARREASARRGPARLSAESQRRSIERREDAAVRRAAVVSAAGWTDAEVLHERTGASVRWLPTALPAARSTPPSRRDTSPTIGYFANFAYHPNVDALEVLVDRWLPALRARGWRLLVAGLESDRLSLPDDVIVEGPVDAIDDFYAAVDATAAPVRLGGGMKVKVAESLLMGRPVVATEFAVDGFPTEVRDHCLVVDVDRPDFSALDALVEVDLPATIRDLFTIEGFTSKIADLLAGAR